MELTDEAKAAIAEAVRIVREDKMWQHIQNTGKASNDPVDPTKQSQTTPPAVPPVPPTDPVANPGTGPVPPPARPEPEPVPEPTKRGLYWGSE